MALLVTMLLFEDEHLLVVNKPAGWNTHAPSPYAGEGIYEWLRHREPRWSRLAIIHRLDKETSGVLVFSKSDLANKALTEQFTTRGVEKTYCLVTDRAGQLKQGWLTVVSNLVRSGEIYVSRPAATGGNRADTHFHLRQTWANGFLSIEAKPLTGRTHQIRVHASEKGFPILGDVAYGGTRAQRVYLHAESIAFHHPATHERVVFSAPCPWSEVALREDAQGLMTPPNRALRLAIIEPTLTDTFRVIHGESDRWPGLYVDRLGDSLLAQSSEPLSHSQLDAVKREAGHYNCRAVYHKMLSRQVRGATLEQSSPRLLLGDRVPERFFIRENGARFEMSFAEGYSVGLFLDQRENRRRLITNHVAAGFGSAFPTAEFEAPDVLNLFAYTCGFSVAAALAGARTTSLDLSRKYLEWGKRNFAANNLDPSRHDFIYGDVFDWMRRLAKKQRVFDLVILDPPTFSKSRESGAWQAEKHYGRLVEAALPLLKPRGILFASTNAARLAPETFNDSVQSAITRSGRKILQIHYVPQPPDFPISRAEPAYLKTIWLRVA